MNKPNPFESCFEQVWVINLKRRPDRLASFWQGVDRLDWPFHRPQVFSAIEGDKVGVPKFWQTGGGSYGCLRSHLILLERALQDEVNSLLVLEDDAQFMPTFRRDVLDFLARVPDDWECLMLGGQHVNSTPFPKSPGILQAGAGGGIQRTHCYALRGREIMRALYQTWCDAAVHCDWVMGPCTAKFNTYAPDPFLVGQSDGPSDISGAHNPPKFWRSATGNEPVIVLQAPRTVMESLRKYGWHTGYNRNRDTGIDCGLEEIFEEEDQEPRLRGIRLGHWISMIQNEVVSITEPSICTLWHPSVTDEMVRPLVRGRIIAVSATTVEEAIAQLPEDIHVQRPLPEIRDEIRVVILRSSRAVMEVLRGEGWHTGYWRDELTGYDNGVRQLLAANHDADALKAGLLQIATALHEEAKAIPRGVVTFWHEQILPDMLAGHDKIEVIEITAQNANEAKAKLQARSHAH